MLHVLDPVCLIPEPTKRPRRTAPVPTPAGLVTEIPSVRPIPIYEFSSAADPPAAVPARRHDLVAAMATAPAVPAAPVALLTMPAPITMPAPVAMPVPIAIPVPIAMPASAAMPAPTIPPPPPAAAPPERRQRAPKLIATCFRPPPVPDDVHDVPEADIVAPEQVAPTAAPIVVDITRSADTDEPEDPPNGAEIVDEPLPAPDAAETECATIAAPVTIAATRAQLRKLQVRDLKALANAYGLPTSGTKDTLVAVLYTGRVPMPI